MLLLRSAGPAAAHLQRGRGGAAAALRHEAVARRDLEVERRTVRGLARDDVVQLRVLGVLEHAAVSPRHPQLRARAHPHQPAQRLYDIAPLDQAHGAAWRQGRGKEEEDVRRVSWSRAQRLGGCLWVVWCRTEVAGAMHGDVNEEPP